MFKSGSSLFFSNPSQVFFTERIQEDEFAVALA
jgi:hypothetical protein